MKIIVVGCGRVGARLSAILSAKGHTVTIIDRDSEAFKKLSSSYKGKTLTGVGFDRALLKEAGIERADALAAVTSSDEINCVIARLASNVFKVPKVVARLYDQRKSDLYNRLGVQTIDPATWGINRIVEIFTISSLETMFSIGSGDVEIIETEISALLAGRQVKDLTLPGEGHVIAITRKNKTFLPMLGTVLEERDVVHLAIAVTAADHLKALLGTH